MMDKAREDRRRLMETAFERGCDSRTIILAGLACQGAQRGLSGQQWRDHMERCLTQQAWLCEALSTIERDLREKGLWPWLDPSDKALKG
jgi:hypothetical protein